MSVNPSLAYSGVVLNQNVAPELPGDILSFDNPASILFPSPSLHPSPSLYPQATGPFYQTFLLPGDYARGEAEQFIPALTGFQLHVNVPSEEAANASLSWELDVYDPQSAAWESLVPVTTSIGAPMAGEQWLTFLFPIPIDVSKLLSREFRLVMLDGSQLDIYYSVPNPLLSGQVFNLATNTALLDANRPFSLMFRLLASVADSGIDLFGNVYRSAVSISSANNISTDATTDIMSYWLSQPNPSHFAVESLYFDVRSNGQPAVIDRLTLNPLTPGVHFHVYYTTESSGGESALWTPVYKTFQANRQDTFAFPQPIVANFVKVEFTNLQTRSYDPGQFQLPTTYKKHPKWVLDYFLAEFASLEHDFLSSGVDVTYDAIDLAFSYYKGDITQDPVPPALSQPLTAAQVQFFDQENATDLIDAQTLSRLRIAFQPFLSQPGLLGRVNTILGAYAANTASTNYSTEEIQTAIGDTSVVSNLQREPLVVEKGFPVMFFFLPCRHGYRLSQAMFEQNIGYFAGVKSLTFHRDVYTGPVDQTQYNEPLADSTNLNLHDFALPVAKLS